jgi:hypothetical protein
MIVWRRWAFRYDATGMEEAATMLDETGFEHHASNLNTRAKKIRDMHANREVNELKQRD